MISPGQVVRFHLGERPEGFAALFVPEFLGEAPSDSTLLHRILSANLRGFRSVSLAQLPIAGLLGQRREELTGRGAFSHRGRGRGGGKRLSLQTLPTALAQPARGKIHFRPFRSLASIRR